MVSSTLISQIQRGSTSHKVRSLVAENYRLRPSGLCCFEIVKPDGSAYIFRPLENSCSCPARGVCFHRRQFLDLLAAELIQGTPEAFRLMQAWCVACSAKEGLLEGLREWATEGDRQ